MAKKCYYPKFTIVNSKGATITVGIKDILSVNSVLGIKYTICCEDNPEPIVGEDNTKYIKIFFKNASKGNESSSLLEIMLAFFTDNTLAKSKGFAGGVTLSLEELKQTYLRDINKIKILRIDFFEVKEENKKFCRCSPAQDFEIGDNFVNAFNDMLCEGTGEDDDDEDEEDPPTEEEPETPTIGMPFTPPPLPETDDPTTPTVPNKTLVIAKNIKYSSDCETGRVDIESEQLQNLMNVLNPQQVEQGLSVKQAISTGYHTSVNTPGIAKDMIKQPIEGMNSTDRKDIIKNSIINNSVLASLTTFDIPKNVMDVSSIHIIRAKTEDDYSHYTDYINFDQSNPRDILFHCPKNFNLTFYNQQKYNKTLSNVFVGLFDAINKEGRIVENKCYILEPLDTIRVPITFSYKLQMKINLTKLIIPFITKLADNLGQEKNCKKINETDSLILTMEKGHIKKNISTHDFLISTTVYVDYQLSDKKYAYSPENNKNIPINNFKNTLGSGKALGAVEFSPGTQDDVINRFTSSIKAIYDEFKQPDALNLVSVVLRNNSGVSLLFNVDDNLIKSIVQNNNVFIPSTSIVLRDTVSGDVVDEFADKDNIDKWINTNSRPKVEYYRELTYSIVIEDGKPAIFSDITGGKKERKSIEKQIINNIDSSKSGQSLDGFSVSLLKSTNNQAGGVLTDKGIELIQDKLNSKIDKSDECCCYSWIIGFLQDGQIRSYIPRKTSSKNEKGETITIDSCTFEKIFEKLTK